MKEKYQPYNKYKKEFYTAKRKGDMRVLKKFIIGDEIELDDSPRPDYSKLTKWTFWAAIINLLLIVISNNQGNNIAATISFIAFILFAGVLFSIPK